MKRLHKWLKKYFIPHGENDFKPHFLRRESMLLVFLAVIIVEIIFLLQVFVIFDKTNFLASVLPGVLTSLTNEKRTENGAGSLTENALLVKAAQMKAQDMASRGYFAHTSPDGKTPWYWLEQVGYSYSSAGENLAEGFFESADVAQAWMNSPTHRENIVKKNYKEIGIGIATGVYEGHNTVFVAQFFGTPITYAQVNTPPITPITQTKPAGTPVKVTPQPKAGQPPAEKPQIPKPTTTPAPAPTSTSVVVAPTNIQVLGEETNPTTLVSADKFTMTNLKAFAKKVLTSPREYVAYAYSGIVMIIILALLLVIFIKHELRHPRALVHGTALIAVILAILFINTQILHHETKIPTEALSASVIEY